MKLIHGDCIVEMANIPDKSVDMILCDLPYGTTKNKWDSVIPFSSLWIHYSRIIIDRGAIVLFAQSPFDKSLGCSNIDLFKYEYIWNKKRPTGYMNANFAPMKQHENILIFSKSSSCYVKEKSTSMKFYPQDLVEVNKLIKRGKQKGNYDHNHYDLESAQRFSGYPRSILEFSTETGMHPTQKPVALLEYLIKTYTLEGETVLDNCMGSGSTGVACLNTGRNFIGIEKDEHYFSVASERISKVITGLQIPVDSVVRQPEFPQHLPAEPCA
jgi:site-specific DNA-methyltransferase (adenine-specific)